MAQARGPNRQPCAFPVRDDQVGDRQASDRTAIVDLIGCRTIEA
jgi:hypothetical protein